MTATPGKTTTARLDYTVEMIDLKAISHADWNPGKRSQDTSLAESIRTDGLQSPVLLRPSGKKKYEVVAGNRRVAGSRAAGLTKVPAFIREMDDTEAMRHCGIENLQRENLPPLEEADWLLMFVELEGESYGSAALEFGLSERYVRERVNLARNLSKDWRDAAQGRGTYEKSAIREWSYSLLAEVAKLPVEIQGELLVEFGADLDDEAVPTLEALRGSIAVDYTHLLKAAPWQPEDDSLIEGKPCAGCPSRSDAQGSLPLWEGVLAKPPRQNPSCLDRSCWEKKLQIFLDRQIEKWRKKYGERLKAYTDAWIASSTWHGLELVRKGSHLYEPCTAKAAAGDETAVPAVIASGPRQGRIQWLVSLRPSSFASSGSGEMGTTEAAADPESLESSGSLDPTSPEAKIEQIEAKRKDLKGRRAVRAAEILEERIFPGDSLQALEYANSETSQEEAERLIPDVVDVDLSCAASMALVFGTANSSSRLDLGQVGFWGNPVARLMSPEPPESHHWPGVTCWDILDRVESLSGEERVQRLFKCQILPVLVGRLRPLSTSTEGRLYLIEECRRICELVGFDFEAIWQEACRDKPEPKSWAQNERKYRKLIGKATS